ILHVAVSESSSLRGWFNDPRSGASSHLYVRRDGTLEQYVDMRYTAWTSGSGSATTIGVETQGMGSGKWTPQQVEALAQIVAWAHREFGVPLRVMSSSTASERGVGYHALGVPATSDQNARGVSKTGGQLWSKAVGKTCPGPERIKQVPEIVARAKQIVAGAKGTTNTGTENEDDMPKLTDRITLSDSAKKHLNRDHISYGGSQQYAAAGGWEAMNRLPRMEATLKALAATVDVLAKSQGADSAAITKAVEEAVTEALRDL